MRDKSSANLQICVTPENRRAAGRAFQVARLETGMSQEELGKRLGRNQDLVSRWERGAPNANIPFEAIRQLGRLVSPASREELFRVTGVTEDESSLLHVASETRRIGLLSNPSDLGDPSAAVDQTLCLPTEWLPQDANIRAAKLKTPVSPIFAGETIALVDIRYRDPDRLLDSIVMVQTPAGTEPMKLRKDGNVFLLLPLRDSGGSVHVMHADDGWTIMGRVIKWIGDAPAPARK